MNEILKEERKKILMFGLLLVVGIMATIKIITTVGSEVRFEKEGTQKEALDLNTMIKNKLVKEIKVKKKEKVVKESSLYELYNTLPKSAIYQGKKIFLSIDDNGNPCYLQDSKFLSKEGKLAPLNYIPENMKCENIKITTVGSEEVVEINSLDAIPTSVKTPKNYRVYLNGDGFDFIIEKCGQYWSDKCLSTATAKIMVSTEGPEVFPRVTSMSSVVLTKKGLIDNINEPTVKYSKNENFYLWRKVPFASPYSINGLIDGEYVNGAEEAYEKTPDIAIDMKNRKVYIKTINSTGVCYYDKNDFPVNRKSEVIPAKNTPPNIDCANLEVKNGNILLKDIDAIVGYKEAKEGYKVEHYIGNQYITLEKCGRYWADNCKDDLKKKIAITGGDRTALPAPKSNSRLSLTKEKGQHKTNTKAGIIHEETGYFVWKNAKIGTSIFDMTDLPSCYDGDCYRDPDIQNVEFAMSGKKLVQKVTNKNGISLWMSLDRNKILAPDTKRWSRIKNRDIITNIADNGMLYTDLKQTMDIFEAKKQCGKLGMRLPELIEVSIENEIGIDTDDWAWTNQMIDNEFYTAWKDQSLLKASNSDEFNVICVGR